MLDRTIAPSAGALKNIQLPTYSVHTLSNGIPVYLLPFGSVEAVTLRVIFRAGKGFQEYVGQADYTARNMPEGTQSYSGYELAQELDTYGTWVGNQTGVEYVSFDLTTLSKFLPFTLKLLKEVLFSPTLEAKEFENMRQRSLQKLQVEAQKTRYHAQRLLGHHLYGAEHPYGMHFGEDEVKALHIDALRTYHREYFFPGNALITVVGNFEEKAVYQELNSVFGQLEFTQPITSPSSATESVALPKPGRIHKSLDGMQSTIRMGHMGFARSHPDFYGMTILNTILGGYFGSRLMQNIREEKGYTYGIGSGWFSLAHGGYFVVQSDVGNEYVEDTIKEVKKEMRILQEERVPEEELQMVKNYLQGRSISERETPFQLSDILRFSLINQLSFEELDRKFEVLRTITAEELRDLAQKYLNPDELIEVVVGGS